MLVIRQVQSFHTGVNWGFPEAEAIEGRLERSLPLALRSFSGRPSPRDPDDYHVGLERGPFGGVDVEAKVTDLEIKAHLLLELGSHRDLPTEAIHCVTIINTSLLFSLPRATTIFTYHLFRQKVKE